LINFITLLTVVLNYQDTKFDGERRERSICTDAKYMKTEVEESKSFVGTAQVMD